MVGLRSFLLAGAPALVSLSLAALPGCSSSGGEAGATSAGGASSSTVASSSTSSTSATSTTSTTSSTSSTTGAGGQGGGWAVAPPKPPELTTWMTGNAADAAVKPTGPGLILMGGSTEVDAAFTWWKPYVNGGDVVILRASGSDGYNDYLYTEIGGVDSVETLLVTSVALAESDYVRFAIEHAEGVFIAGGDQGKYMAAWKGTGVETALMTAWSRGAILGGTSAGCDVLGELIFTAANGSVTSAEALADPYNEYMTLDRDFLALPLLKGFITDTHFAQRDRLGRMVGFLGRVLADGWATEARGIGIDEETALVVDKAGQGKVLGNGAVYLLEAKAPPALCAAGKPLEYAGLALRKLGAGATITLPSGATAAPATTLSAAGGALTPANPY